MSAPSHGILVVDKPAGPTSFQVVKAVRRRLGLRKVGHLGTLDPFATGVLPLCCGPATKLAPFLLDLPKTYRATMYLGVETDTQDGTGTVVARSEALPAPDHIASTLAALVGEHWQTPPLYSAIHVQGLRLYEYARRGLAVEVAARPVQIYAVSLENIALPEVTFTVACSKGTYIRTLAADLGRQWGCGAHLRALRRLQVGPFTLAQAVSLEALDRCPEAAAAALIPMADCLPHLPAVEVDAAAAARLVQGQAVPAPAGTAAAIAGAPYCRLVCQGRLLAVGALTAEAKLQPVRVLGAG
jgi:tRNA pseudouridine55 synthase